MIKWIKYHFLHLNDKRWKITTIVVMVFVVVMILYLGGALDTEVERLLFRDRNLLELKYETFTLLNLLALIWVLMGTKEIFLLEEPHILLINKTKYLISKAITYLLFYLLLFMVFYGLYQLVVVYLYGFINFDYKYIIHLALNINLIHSILLLLSGKTKNIMKMILLIIVLFALDKLKEINNFTFNIIDMFYPLLSLDYPYNGYGHVILISIFYYILAIIKHEFI